jgi:hypothetical protein
MVPLFVSLIVNDQMVLTWPVEGNCVMCGVLKQARSFESPKAFVKLDVLEPKALPETKALPEC